MWLMFISKMQMKNIFAKWFSIIFVSSFKISNSDSVRVKLDIFRKKSWLNASSIIPVFDFCVSLAWFDFCPTFLIVDFWLSRSSFWGESKIDFDIDLASEVTGLSKIDFGITFRTGSLRFTGPGTAMGGFKKWYFGFWPFCRLTHKNYAFNP